MLGTTQIVGETNLVLNKQNKDEKLAQGQLVAEPREESKCPNAWFGAFLLGHGITAVCK